jgi:2'-5' RNA ligase
VTDRLRSHWWWRPGWGPGTRYLTWHVLLTDQEAVRAAVARHQAPLLGLEGISAIPEQWLHLTLSGVGFAPELTGAEREHLVRVARRRLRDVAPFEAPLGRAVVHPEGALLPVEGSGFVAVRGALRSAAAEALGEDRVADRSTTFAPHVSFAYADGDADAAPVRAAIAGQEPDGTLAVAAVSLLELERDERVYRWRVLARVPLGG